MIDTFTVTSQVALFPPAIAVIVALPPPTAVTTPVDDTVTTFGLDVVQLILLLDASDGVMVAINEKVSPLFMDALVLFNVIPVTCTTFSV